jgi:membrane-associated protease RseP (regulator of RpoE activity)
VRTLLSVLLVVPFALDARAVSADESSNPAFLGVSMSDIGPSGPCRIGEVTPDSGAAQAGIRYGDLVIALDATPIANCDGLVKSIQAREPGQPVKIQVQRNGAALTLETALPSRADVLRKRFVGKPVPLKTLTRVDDLKTADLTGRGKTTIIGWYDQSQCASCASAFSTISDWVRNKGSRTNISVMGVTASRGGLEPEALDHLKKAERRMDVPLLIADPETFSELSINDVKRIHFMVIDCRGIVSYTAPLKPDADDRDAVLEELYAATEQAARRASK